ncbi:UbiA prenyltransferase family protein [Leptonema illini]|uniref:UbiA prenyltransferase n=1 Tax=Leptonema illini DSM 21528 TaxID=929563 RepID=H2CAX7_9LEPT|nr:UbiA prenyltransferase family protein [Leptonema illini]EHQ08572.1 UbiA prenyltransferase [Leptonema illini DSM 21528]
MQKVKAYVRLIRVYQWTKSGFIFLPFVFSTKAISLVTEPFADYSLVILSEIAFAFFGFSFMASAIYVLNDWKDRELDRLDPKKKKRPLASGTVSALEGALIGVALAVSGLFLASQAGTITAGIVLAYAAMNVFYTYYGKNVLLLDVFIISVGFVLRVLAGAYAIEVEASPWLLSCTFFISLFLGFYKRYFEISNAPAEPMLGGQYRRESLKSFIDISAGLAIMTYSLYTIQGTHAGSMLYLTIPFVVMGIFRYYTLLDTPAEIDGNPSDVLLADLFLAFVIFAWVAVCFGLIFYFEYLHA